MPTKDAAAPAHVCPHIGIHAIDSVQPPGIGISPMFDMDRHHATVTAVLAADSSADTPRKACRRSLSATARRAGAARLRLVLVVTAPPDARLVASLRGTVEPLVRAPEAVESARIGGIRVVDRVALAHERTHARSLARVRGHVGSGRRRELGHGPLAASFLAPAPLPRRLAPVVVVDALPALL